MFHFLYHIAMQLISHMLPILARFNSKIKAFVELRKKASAAQSGSKKYWFHCASLGEYEMALPLINHLMKECHQNELLITFFSPNGYEQAIKNEALRGSMMYLPIDNRKAVDSFFNTYQIQKGVFVRYELWYNLIKQGLSKGVSFYLINGRFRKQHFIFSWFALPYKQLLKQFRWIATSDETSFKVLEQAGYSNIVFAGDTRFDRVRNIVENSKKYEDIEDFKGTQKLIILGSSWQAEEELMSNVLYHLDGYKIIIAPHDISKRHIDQILHQFHDFKAVLYSGYTNKDVDANVLIIDSIGHLSSLYAYADLAFVGGGFKAALHNTIEPAVWGVPLLFGPEISKFPEAATFIENGFAFTIASSDELLIRIKNVQPRLAELRERTISFCNKQFGASQRVLDYLNK